MSRGIRFCDLNPATMPGFGDPETWGGRTPYGDPPDDERGEDPDWDSLEDLIDTLEENP